MNGNSVPDIERTRRILLIIEAAIAVSVLAYGTVGLLLERMGARPPAPAAVSAYLKPVFLAIIILIFPLIRKGRRALHDSAGESLPAGERAPRLMRGYVMLLAAAELPAVLGLVLFMLGEPPGILALAVGLSLFYLAMTTPRPGLAPPSW